MRALFGFLFMLSSFGFAFCMRAEGPGVPPPVGHFNTGYESSVIGAFGQGHEEIRGKVLPFLIFQVPERVERADGSSITNAVISGRSLMP